MRLPLLCLIIFLLLAVRCDATFGPAMTFPKAGKCACVDYDKDGFADLVIGLTIHHNRGNGTFEQIGTLPATVGPAGTSFAGPTAWVDFDGDGVRDVLILGDCASSKHDADNNAIGHAPDRIFKVAGYSDGIPTLGSSVDITGWDVSHLNQNGIETLMANPNATFGIAIADINRDGKPDIYLGRGRIGDLGAGDAPEWYGKDWLAKNISSGGAIAMVDISNDIGLTRANQYCSSIFPEWEFRSTDSVGACDYDYDGLPDFFCTTYRGKCNAFWKGGLGGKHGYTIINASDQHQQQTTTGLDLTNMEDPDCLHGCGVYWFDYDNDGYPDLLEARFSHYIRVGALRLWHNDGDGTFTNASNLMPQIDDEYNAQQYKSVAVGDYDNDGDLDVYLTRRGSVSVQDREDLPPCSQGRLLKNGLVETGRQGFTDATAEENLDNGSHADGFSTCFIDFDNDGKLDLFTAPGYCAAGNVDELWRNNGDYAGHWLVVDLSPPREVGGIRINPDAIGAVVQIWIDSDRDGQTEPGEVLTRQQIGYTTGNLWQGPVPLHFGLGACSPDQIPMKGRILWPGAIGADGKAIWTEFEILSVNRRMTVSAAPAASGAPGIPYAQWPYSGGDVTFSWEPAEDLGLGVAGYRCQIGTSPKACDVFDGAVGNAVSKTLSGSEGTYYCRVCALDRAGREGAWSPSSDGVTVDLSPPVGDVVIDNGATYTGSRSAVLRLSAVDSGSGIAQMRFSTDGISWSEWECFSELGTIQLPTGDGVKCVRASFKDVVGNVSTAEDTITLDQTAAEPGTLVSPAIADSSPVTITYTGAYDHLSGVKSVSLWFKQIAGGAWLPASCACQYGRDGSFEFTDLTSQGTYYFTLVAEDNVGNRSALPPGDGVAATLFTGNTPCTIGAAKAAPTGTVIDTIGIVTADFHDCFYIETGNRMVGIRVVTDGENPTLGTCVRVKGTTSALPSGELAVAAASFTSLDGSVIITPMCMTNRSIGGGRCGSQLGISGSAGLNNMGLLVRVYGTAIGVSGDSFALRDGSGPDVLVTVPLGVALPDEGAYTAVTGIVSCRKDAAGRIQRLILATDLSTY